MPLRFLLRYFANDKVVERLSHSWPVRWAARRVADGMVRSIKAAEDLAKSEAAKNAMRKSTSLQNRFREELRKGFEEMNKRNQK